MKKAIAILSLFCVLILCFTACTYNPPDGYTEEHHTYEEILAFAKSIDPDATVSKEYTDTTIDDWNRNFREYPAVINGVECHVSSVGDMVWNSGFLAGEFARQYYVIDTDYDYLALKQIVAEHNPDWSISEDTLGMRYNWNNILSVYMEPNCTEQLEDEMLDAILEQANEIYSAYHNLPIRKELYFWLPAPGTAYNSDKEKIVKRNSKVLLEHFTEEGKLAFIDKYHEAWALLDSGLPIQD
jgi:hypothetical protein